MLTEYEKSKVNKIRTDDGKVVFYAFTDKTDYRFKDLPGWAQALPDNALLIINPDFENGQVVLPDYIRTMMALPKEGAADD